MDLFTLGAILLAVGIFIGLFAGIALKNMGIAIIGVVIAGIGFAIVVFSILTI